MKYTPEQRESLIQQAKGKVIESMEWFDDDGYWLIAFTDGSEMCVRLMAESEPGGGDAK
jgi:hypothetical protein